MPRRPDSEDVRPGEGDAGRGRARRRRVPDADGEGVPAPAAARQPAGGRLPGARHRGDAHPAGLARPLDEGRMLALSPFPSVQRRPTAALAARRNEYVAELAARVFIAHAAPGGRTRASRSSPWIALPTPTSSPSARRRSLRKRRLLPGPLSCPSMLILRDTHPFRGRPCVRYGGSMPTVPTAPIDRVYTSRLSYRQGLWLRRETSFSMKS